MHEANVGRDSGLEMEFSSEHDEEEEKIQYLGIAMKNIQR